MSLFELISIAISNIQSIGIFVAGFVSISLLIVILLPRLMMSSDTRMPPGPSPLPFIGNVLDIGKHGSPIKAFKEFAGTYGDIFTVYFGKDPVVVLSNYNTIKEALLTRGDVFSGRSVPKGLREFFSTDTGVIMCEGTTWKEHRRYSLRHLRNLGFGQVKFEEKIHTEVTLFIEAIRSYNGNAFNIDKLLGSAVTNIISLFIFEERFEYTDEEFHLLRYSVAETGNVAFSGVANVFPFLKYIPFLDIGGIKKRRNAMLYLNSSFKKRIDSMKATFNPDSTDNIIDLYLKGRQEHEATGQPLKGSIFEDKQLYRLITDLFLAGTETVSTSIRWSLLYMITNQEIQDKVRAELDKIVGNGRLPSLNDRRELHYTEAVLTELLRISDVVPLALPHRVTEDVMFHGYEIPKGTTVMANLNSVLMNEKDFPNPTEFKPERYLNSEGIYVRETAEKVIPFGMGNRVCLGEPLARMELFLFFTSLIQNFNFRVTENMPQPDLTGIYGLAHLPTPYEVCAFPIL